MTPECWQQIDELLDAALARAPHERAAFLDQVCADDEALRHKVKALLTAHERAGDFLEAPALEIAAQLRAEEQVRSLLGCELGPYRILSLLGAGGMGEVYRARDARLEREVAVKVLPEHLAQNPEALLRFQREAKAVAALSHPNILAIHDVGAERGVHFAVMELLEGETLRQRLEHAALPWRKAVEIGVAVTEGLQAAHAKGIIHRDLKPENIFLTNDGQVKILDFGIARVKQMMATPAAASELTKTGAVIGTVGYMSPEQLRGQEADAPSDIFSLGCVLYEMVARRRPFVGQSAAETITAIMTEDPPALAATGKEFPLELERVIKRCLEKQASERFQSARYLGFALRAVLNDSGATASAPARLRARLRPAIWIGVAMAVLLFGIAVWSYLRGAGKQAVDSLVVLPLANGSSDPNLEYLSDGITEGIINSVSQLPGLKVVARTTAFRYKGREVDPQAIGRELKVRTVFIGKVTQRGETLSVQADLLDAADGSQLWGEQYHRRVADLIPLQEEIALQIAEKLRLKLTRAEQQRLKKHYPENAEAYLLYLKGDFYYSKLTPDGARTSIAYFNQALAKDPEYALAYSGLSLAQGLLPETDLPGRERCLKAKFYAEKALLLNDELAEAHVALGTFNFFLQVGLASERAGIAACLGAQSKSGATAKLLCHAAADDGARRRSLSAA
jgi:eukaryotic-like serine/threonine-protein kinase